MLLSFSRQAESSPRARRLESLVLGAVMLGVRFREMLLCDLGREGKTGVQVHCRAFGGAWGSWCRNKGEQGFCAVDGVWREEQVLRGGGEVAVGRT